MFTIQNRNQAYLDMLYKGDTLPLEELQRLNAQVELFDRVNRIGEWQTFEYSMPISSTIGGKVYAKLKGSTHMQIDPVFPNLLIKITAQRATGIGQEMNWVAEMSEARLVKHTVEERLEFVGGRTFGNTEPHRYLVQEPVLTPPSDGDSAKVGSLVGNDQYSVYNFTDGDVPFLFSGWHRATWYTTHPRTFRTKDGYFEIKATLESGLLIGRVQIHYRFVKPLSDGVEVESAT